MFKGGDKAQFDKSLERATSANFTDADFETLLYTCDMIRSGEIQGKYAVNSIKKKLDDKNNSVIYQALITLDLWLKNCGPKIQEDVFSQDFTAYLSKLAMKPVVGPRPKEKLLEMICIWTNVFGKKYPDLHQLVFDLKAAGIQFPEITQNDAEALFEAETAPEWLDAFNCQRCQDSFGLITRKHHCRNCGDVFCSKCCSKNAHIPRLGFSKPVRVCENCYDELKVGNEPPAQTRKKSSKASRSQPKSAGATASLYDSRAASQSADAAKARAQQEEEEEQLQLALALSKSEFESKKQPKSTATTRSKVNFVPASELIPEDNEVRDNRYSSRHSQPATYDSGNNAAASSATNSELAKYLDRSYWETKANHEQRDTRDNVPPTAPSPTNSDASMLQSAMQPQLSLSLAGGAFDATPYEGLLTAIESQLKTFIARLKSNKDRGRSIIDDSAIQNTFVTLSTMNEQLLKQMSDVEEKRAQYEGLQEKLSSIRDARAALDALRLEEVQRQQAMRAAEEARKRDAIMAKLGQMRQQKNQQLESQRHEYLMRLQQHQWQWAQRQGELNAAQQGMTAPGVPPQYANQPPQPQPAVNGNGHGGVPSQGPPSSSAFMPVYSAPGQAPTSYYNPYQPQQMPHQSGPPAPVSNGGQNLPQVQQPYMPPAPQHQLYQGGQQYNHQPMPDRPDMNQPQTAPSQPQAQQQNQHPGQDVQTMMQQLPPVPKHVPSPQQQAEQHSSVDIGELIQLD